MNTTQPPVADAGPRPRLSARAAGLTSSAIRDLLAHARRPGMISFAGGLPAAAMFDLEGLHAATAAVLETGVDVFQYGATEGQDDLRQALARLMGERGAPVECVARAGHEGSQQALDLVVRSLLDPGATVVVERPSYLAALQVLHLAQARVVAVDVDADGLCVERLDAACAGLAPRLAYVVPTFANPSGACLSLARRLALLEWAVRHDVWLIEDDPYGELRFGGEPLPSLLALAPRVPGAAARVIHVCSLSKVVAPALRIGWTVLPEALVGPVTRVKQSLDLQTSALTQEIAARYLGSGRLPTRVAAIARAYGARKRASPTRCIGISGIASASTIRMAGCSCGRASRTAPMRPRCCPWR
ncbi:MAG: PLP-dependent aminotransferase family protein [Burkholderiaceae bacterium]